MEWYKIAAGLDIDMDLVAKRIMEGVSIADIAREMGLYLKSLRNHIKKHLLNPSSPRYQPEIGEKIKQNRKETLQSPEYSKMRSDMMSIVSSERIKRLWRDGPERMRRLWNDPEFKAKVSERIKQDPALRERLSRNLWSDPALKEMMSEKMKQDTELKKRMSTSTADPVDAQEQLGQIL